MIFSVIIATLTCIALILCVMIKPEVKIKNFTLPLYPAVALLGAIASVAFTPLTFYDCVNGIVGGGAVNPLKILTLFISVTLASVFLDEVGFFEFLACKVLKSAGKSRFKLFLLLYATVAILTVFTSNDVIILTFTPFIMYFCKNAKIKSTPFLVAEFTAANTWSMALIIGNPTNVYIATSAGIGFIDYVKVMAIPTLLSGLAGLLALLLLFYKQLKAPIEVSADPIEAKIKDKPLCVLGLVILGVCTIGLAISGYIGVEMWLECAVCAVALIIFALLICAVRRTKPTLLGHALLRVPYSLIPFVIGMFVVVLSLNKCGATKHIAKALSYNELWEYGAVSFISCNLVNNIPMSVLFSSVISYGGAGKAAVYATVIGSNLGALLTPVGALAGIMFSSLTKKSGERFSNLQFICYGSCTSLFSLGAALGALLIFV